MKKVILMVGVAGSGKSSYLPNVVAKFAPDETPWALISTDKLRAIHGTSENDQSVSRFVFMVAEQQLRDYLATNDVVVIVDAMNLTRKSRKRFVTVAREFGAEIIAVYMATPLLECIRRNDQRVRKVPIDVIKNQATRLSPPQVEDGEVDHVLRVEPNQTKYQ